MQQNRQVIWQEQYLHCVFSKNNYNNDFTLRNTHQPTATTETNNTATLTTTAAIPYLKGMSENMLHILQPFNIHVAHKTHHCTTSVTNQH